MALISYEFPFMLEAQKITQKPTPLEMEATPAECAAIAKRLDLLSPLFLKASLKVTRLTDGVRLEVTGQLNAQCTQACVYTLEPVETKINAEIKAFYMDDAHVASFTKNAKKKALQDGDDDMLEREMPDDADEPEELVNGKLPLGELVVQHLSLALPPYPQAAGAEEKLGVTLQKLGAKENAFAKLKALKKEGE